MNGHIIVSGLDGLASRVIEWLRRAGGAVVILDRGGEADLLAAEIYAAKAIVCVGPDDAANLEIALLARQLNSDVRVVTRLANAVLRKAVAQNNGPGAVLDVADLAAPSVVEACLARPVHPLSAAGADFLVSGAEVTHGATLRELYGDLAPVAVVRGEKGLLGAMWSPAPGATKRFGKAIGPR